MKRKTAWINRPIQPREPQLTLRTQLYYPNVETPKPLKRKAPMFVDEEEEVQMELLRMQHLLDHEPRPPPVQYLHPWEIARTQLEIEQTQPPVFVGVPPHADNYSTPAMALQDPRIRYGSAGLDGSQERTPELMRKYSDYTHSE